MPEAPFPEDEALDWELSSLAPDFIMPEAPSPEDEALDWELSSLVRAKMPHGGYEYDNKAEGPITLQSVAEGAITYQRNPAAGEDEGSDSD
eukprot:gene16401-22607_t